MNSMIKRELLEIVGNIVEVSFSGKGTGFVGGKLEYNEQTSTFFVAINHPTDSYTVAEIGFKLDDVKAVNTSTDEIILG